MHVDRALVLHIARLAMLELPRTTSDQERLLDDATLDRHGAELNQILAHVAELDALDLKAVPPTSHGVPLPPLLRPDELAPLLDTERALEGAPARVGDCFAVPKLIE